MEQRSNPSAELSAFEMSPYFSMQKDLFRQRYEKAVLALKLLEPMIEDADDEPVELVERLCTIILSAMELAPHGDAWTHLWAKYIRWNSTLIGWRTRRA